ncbi:metallophosphoesterase [Pontibacterium sp.]|uniref:metallophosphoesterase n=1 Tax=Pontibacterium sp. TaxID=2036026 RepID=UPI0035168D99
MMLKQHKHMPVNVEGRDWFVGDLHGHYSLLMKTLEQMGFDFDRDRLFAVGDLIDRGPESPECIRLLLEPWFHSVCGNHECMFINGRLADDHPHIHGMHIKNGGAWAYEISEKEGNELFQIIRSYMPMCLTVDTLRGSVGVVHAQAPRDWKKVLDGFTP